MFNLITIKDFAKELGKPESTIRTWILREDIPSYLCKKIGGTVFIKKDKFAEWVDKE